MYRQFDKLAYESIDDFVYGTAKRPVNIKNGMKLGAGKVYPEINFTLPPIDVNSETMSEIRTMYKQMIDGILNRAKELYADGIVVELELLPPMTENPEWGIQINKIVRDSMYEYESKYNLKSALRITPNDIRDIVRPPLMTHGKVYDSMLETFEGCARDGADLLAIESTGGKEIHDDALINADLKKVIFSLGVLGVRDMKQLWANIVDIAKKTGSIASGDTACGFGNTAMILAEKGFIPRVFAAVVRAATVSRSLIAYEMGAEGPSKDCAYEGPYMKAIAGVPISMEGKSSACAHLSPLGNIPAAVADLWSNESVQYVKLLSDMAPIVSVEQLIYDCRLLNEASRQGKSLDLRDMLADSDSHFDPQAYILRPEVVYDISGKLVNAKNPLVRTREAAYLTIDKIRSAFENKELNLPKREIKWLDIMESQIEEIPDDEDEFYHDIKDELDMSKFLPDEYNLE